MTLLKWLLHWAHNKRWAIESCKPLLNQAVFLPFALFWIFNFKSDDVRSTTLFDYELLNQCSNVCIDAMCDVCENYNEKIDRTIASYGADFIFIFTFIFIIILTRTDDNWRMQKFDLISFILIGYDLCAWIHDWIQSECVLVARLLLHDTMFATKP